MFKIDPDSHINTDLVRVAGLRSRLYPYQAFGTWWQMKKSRQVGGGFVGDEMGLGKTLSFLAYLVAERQLAWLWNQVQLSRSNAVDDGKHHKLDNDPRPCPTEEERPYWISCPCSASNPTSQMKLKPGVRVAVVPAPLILTWVSEWDKHIDVTDKRLEMRLAVAHPPLFASGAISASALRNAKTRVSYQRMRATRVTTDIRMKCAHDEAPPGQERVLLLTTAQSFKSTIKDYEYETEIQITRDKRNTTKKIKNAGIVFGIAMIDEVHETRPRKGESKAGILAEVPITNSPFLWGYSGTPITSSPRGLEQILFAIEDRSPKTRLPSGAFQTAWQTSPLLQKFSYQNLNEICREYENWVTSRLGMNVGNLLQGRFQPFLEMFLLRRTAESAWFGQPLMKLKIHRHHDVTLKHYSYFDKHLDEFEKSCITDTLEAEVERRKENWTVRKAAARTSKQKDELDFRPGNSLPFAVEYAVTRKLRLFASFPYLVKFALAPKGPEHLEFDREETRIRGAASQVRRSLYGIHLKGICECSPKLGWLYNFLKDFFAKADESCDGDVTRERKLIIVSSHDPAILLIKLVSHWSPSLVFT